MKKTVLYLLLLLLLLSSQAKAVEEHDDYYYDPETKTITGQMKKNEIYALDNFAENVKSSGANVDIITRDDMKKQNIPSFSNMLNQLGSVTVQNSNGSDGSISSVRIRGTDRVRMTIDGIRADRPSLTTPGVEPQFILLDDVELVEVIKGPQGNVSGTNASGGVIALQTRRGRGRTKFELGSDFGNYSTFKERFAVMGGNEKADYYLATTWYKTNGGMWTSNLGGLYNDDYNNLNVVSNLGLRLLDSKAEVRDIFRFSRARKGLGLGYDNLNYEYYNDPNSYSKNIDISNALIFKHAPTDFYNYDMKFGLYHNNIGNYTLENDRSEEHSRSVISSTRLNFMTQHNLKYKDWNTFSLGYNLESELIDGESNSLLYGVYSKYPMESYDSKYSGSTIQNDVYVNDVINIKDILFLRGGARLVNNSQYGTYVTPNASAALILPTFNIKGAKTKFRGSWGQSVNTPTLYQRYGVLKDSWMTWVGNPDLEAEKMQSWDVGVEQSFMDDKIKLEFGYFDSRYRDYISGFYEYDKNWNMYGFYENLDRAHIRGYEAKASWEPNDKFKFVVNYTYTDSEDEKTGYALPAVPKNRINGTIYWTPIERLNLYFGIIGSSERAMSSSSDATAPGYVDAQIGTSIRLFTYKGASMYLKANIYNLFNQNICVYKNTYTNDYYYSPKIRFRAGLFLEYNLPERKRDKV